MRRGRLRRLRAGTLLPWTRPPYGYRLSPDRPRDPAGVRLDEAEAATVRNIFTWYVEDGLPLTAMVRRLSRLGIVSPKGKALWAASALRGLLTNPTYVGEVYANRTRATPSARRQSALHPVGKTGTTNLLTARGDWIAVADVPAIVTRGQFDAAQERLTRNRQLASGTTRSTHISCVAWSAAAIAAGAAPDAIWRRPTTTIFAVPRSRCASWAARNAATPAISRLAPWRRWSGATCARCWPIRT